MDFFRSTGAGKDVVVVLLLAPADSVVADTADRLLSLWPINWAVWA